MLEIFGMKPWTLVEMPEWFLDKKARGDVWHNCKVDLFCAGGATSPYTYMHADGRHPPMPRTDGMDMLPACVEVMAQAAYWDSFGVRWGRGAHWPLLATMGTGRYRNAYSKSKRNAKNQKKKEAPWNERYWQGW